MNQDYVEKLILKLLLQDKQYLVIISSVFDKRYFDNHDIGIIVECAGEHYRKYKETPPFNIIENIIDPNRLKDLLSEIESIDFDFAKHYDYFIDETNNFLKNQAIKQAILDGVDIVNNNGDLYSIRELVEKALAKDLKIDIGLDYYNTIGERLKRLLSGVDRRIPTYYYSLDEYLSGGFPFYTLTVFGAAIHGWKTQTEINLAVRQTLHGHNVVMYTMEMSQDAYAQRIDGIHANKDINRLYINKETTVHLVKKLKEIRSRNGLGTLIIKEFPTGDASVNDFRKHLRELAMRDIKMDIIYVDYLQLMKTAAKGITDLYSRGKKISEELRALSFEFRVPVVTVSQLKTQDGRSGNVNDLSVYSLQESSGIPATADAIILLGADEDGFVYENELFYIITKNRLGGQVGVIDKLYYDTKSLKLYDKTEMSQWLKDKEESGDSRNIKGSRERE